VLFQLAEHHPWGVSMYYSTYQWAAADVDQQLTCLHVIKGSTSQTLLD
jgi:hypothetical protein